MDADDAYRHGEHERITELTDAIDAFLGVYQRAPVENEWAAIERLAEVLRKAPWPRGKYEVYADDDDVIGLTVAKTYPHGWPIMRTEPPIEDAFDEFEVGKFLAWCLTSPMVVSTWRTLGKPGE